jgi:hypothetical protein
VRAGPDADEWQEEEIAARDAGRDQAQEGREEAMARQRAERIAAALAAEEARRAIEEGRNEPVAEAEASVAVPRPAGAGSLVRRIFGGSRTAEASYEASALQFRSLEGGYVSVSGSPDFSQAARAAAREAWELEGTRYLPETIAGRVSGGLLGRSVSRVSVLFSAGTALLGNLIDYGLGEHRETGVLSAEFAVSTLVDFGLALATGIASAALVALGATLVGATLPIWGAVALTGLVGLGIGLLLEAVNAGDAIQGWIMTSITGGSSER